MAHVLAQAHVVVVGETNRGARAQVGLLLEREMAAQAQHQVVFVDGLSHVQTPQRLFAG